MKRYYRKTLVVVIALLGVTASVLCIGVSKARVSASLFPKNSADFHWETAIEPTLKHSKTRLTPIDAPNAIAYQFFLDPADSFPYTHYSLDFTERHQAAPLDLTGYEQISFDIKCDPKNVLLFVLFSFDESVTQPEIPATRRISSTAFSCNAKWKRITLAFDDLVTPHWWLQRYGFELSDRGYQLSKTMGFALVNSLQSPVGTLSQVRLREIKMLGESPSYLYASAGFSLFLWLFFLVWVGRATLSSSIEGQSHPVNQAVDCAPLSVDSPKEKQKAALLHYMATEYERSTLTLDRTAAELGINRTKINAILKETHGLTFRAYLNKLRMTEAARLLSHNKTVNVSQVAYSVGYNSVSYFNKLFKAEYGCTPNGYRDRLQSEAS